MANRLQGTILVPKMYLLRILPTLVPLLQAYRLNSKLLALATRPTLKVSPSQTHILLEQI